MMVRRRKPGEAAADPLPCAAQAGPHVLYLALVMTLLGAECTAQRDAEVFSTADRPVESVSWNKVRQFIQRLNERQDEYTYRLPAEAEWEFACRAGTTGEYAGDLESMAWSGLNAGGQTHAVGQKQANAADYKREDIGFRVARTPVD